jgi:hypothetical protein
MHARTGMWNSKALIAGLSVSLAGAAVFVATSGVRG